MENRLTITISDTVNIKTYYLHKIIKKTLIAISIIIVSVIVSGFWLISYLTSEMDTLKISKERQIASLIKKKDSLIEENTKYNIEIKAKLDDIEKLSTTLVEIEEIIGVSNDTNISLVQRVDVAKLTSAQKIFMLQTIPSGSPLKNTATTASFGKRVHPISKKRHFHTGIDLRAKRKTKLYATADGVVKYVRKKIHGGYGTVIIIAHNYGFDTLYGHLNRIYLKVGDVVKKNDIIGLTGNTGNSTGPHLHYEVRYANKVLNPRRFMDWNMQNYDKLFKKEGVVQWESLVKIVQNQVAKLLIQQ